MKAVGLTEEEINLLLKKGKESLQECRNCIEAIKKLEREFIETKASFLKRAQMNLENAWDIFRSLGLTRNKTHRRLKRELKKLK